MTKQTTKIDPRLQALKILLQVLPGAKSPKSLNQLCQNKIKQQHKTRDHAKNEAAVTPFTQVLVYGVCRYYQPLQTIITSKLAKPLKAKDSDIGIILLLGLFQILFTTKPSHAIINHTTELARKRKKKWATGLINGILRTLERAHKAGELETIKPATTFPAWLHQMISAQYTPANAEHIFEQSLTPAPMSLRHNPNYDSLTQFQQALAEANIKGDWLDRTPDCFTLSEPTAVETIPAFFQGSCSVQDEAAQWSTRLLNPTPGSHVLDACAAPGGKTGHLLEWADDITLTALDISPERLSSIQSNLDRLRQRDNTQSKAKLLAADAADLSAWWDQTPFDFILLDAPCSGSGVLRRHPDIFWLKRSSDIKQLAQLQERLLKTLWTTLKPGGTLLYCTCSILAEENGLQISNFLADQSDARLENLDNTPIAKSSKIALTESQQDVGLQILPKAQQHDGFYYALLKKSSAE